MLKYKALMRSIFTILFLFIFSCTYAQVPTHGNKWILGPTVSYQYQTKNFVKASVWGLTDLGYANYLKIDAGANFTWHEHKTYVIPEVGATYYLSSLFIWPYVKAEVTPYTVTPKVGLGLFNIVELGLGYGWSIQEKSNLGKIKGLNFSLGVSLPLNYYF